MFLILIRDVNDSIEFEKIQLKQKEDEARNTLINSDLNQVFTKHCNTIENLIDMGH